MKNRMITLAVLMFAAFPVVAQRDFSAVEITVTPVAGNIYMLQGAGGNIAASVGDDGIVIIDDQYAPLVPKIEAALRKISERPVRFVINTHWHGDHTGGNEQFGRAASIVAHSNVRKRLLSGSTVGTSKYPPAALSALPIVTFDHDVSLHFNGEEIRAVHYPNGHTDGDSVIWFTKSNVVHLGDNYFAGRFPFIDLDSGGSVRGLIAATKKAIEATKPDAKIIPGHGPLSNLAELREYLKMLQETSAVIERGIKAGKNLEALIADKPLAKWEHYSWQFVTSDRFVETLYLDLRSSRARK